MDKTTWGNATWYLFHTLAYKLKDEHSGEAANLLAKFREICAHLPCPSCAGHATTTLALANLNLVNNRDSLIRFLFEFHNKVNVRTNKKEFSMEEHNELYSRARTGLVVRNFLGVMSSNANNSRLMMDAHSRQRCIKMFEEYVYAHRHLFNV